MYEDAERPAAHALSRPPQILMSVAYKVRWSCSAVVPYKTTSLRSSKIFQWWDDELPDGGNTRSAVVIPYCGDTIDG